ncbi:MAG: ABC transporter permease [Flavobacteriaceae bacterium]
MGSINRNMLATMSMTSAGFVVVALFFFLAIGQPPLKTLADMVLFAVGDSYSLSETLLKTAPILLCALAAAVPGRLGLISVGAEGQLHVGAIFGTAVVLVMGGLNAWALIPLMIFAAVAGGGLFGFVPGYLRARLEINETISTLVLNYVGILLVSALVYGPWRDPVNLGWPATAPFPPSAVLPALGGSRVHLGLVLGLMLAVALHFAFTRGRWALSIRVLAGNRKVGETYGLDYGRQVVALMALGGAIAGIAGIVEVSAVQGRLQPGISVGYGLTGFLVAWLSGHRPLVIVPVSVVVAGLISAGDALQLFAKVPAASVVILQGLLFATALAVPGLWKRFGKSHGN